MLANAGARRVARRSQGRWQDGGIQYLQPVQSGRLVLMGRCRRAVRAGAEELVSAPGLRQHRARRDVDDARRGAGLESVVRPA